jgi:hypothetical protein
MDAYELDQPYLQIDDETYYDDNEGAEYLIYDDGYIEQKPRWTQKRVVWFLIALVIIVAMIGLLIMPFLQTVITPIPSYIPPPITPPSQL